MNEPARANTAAPIHAPATPQTESKYWATAPGTRKMPAPMVMPTTMARASAKPSSRRNCAFSLPLNTNTHAQAARSGLVQIGHSAYTADHTHLRQRRDVHFRIRPVGMVERVRRSEFPAQVEPLGDCEVFRQSRVEDV